MALHRLSKSKIFHVNYCGCTTAALLLDDHAIRNAIDYIFQVKKNCNFIKTTLTTLRDGVKIEYNDGQKFSTVVPSTMVAGSAIGKFSSDDTVGVVYISPLTGEHYPAFVHVYRCNTARIAQKLLSRLRSYLLVEIHRLQMINLEKQLLSHNLLNIDHFNAMKSRETSTAVSSSPTGSGDRQEKQNDPIKLITEEFQKKINLNEPILFPPKDYDTLHAAHGHIQRAQAWKSTEPTIIGFSSIDPDNSRTEEYQPINALSTTDEYKSRVVGESHNPRSSLPTHQRDAIVDPVEAVNLAFDFLKDEISSICTDNDVKSRNVESQQQTNPSVYRFRPRQVTALTKRLFNRNNNYEFANGLSQTNVSSKNDLDIYNNNINNNNNHSNHSQYRARSDNRAYYDQQPHMQHNFFYEHRHVNATSAPTTTNPLWTPSSSALIGSQPNLLSQQNYANSTALHRHLNPQARTRISSTPLQNSPYTSYPDNKLGMMTKGQETKQKRIVQAQRQSNRTRMAESQYLDTNEFILRASNGQPLRNIPYPDPHASREYRSHSMNTDGLVFDVYY